MQGSLNLTGVQNSIFFFPFSSHHFWHLKHSSLFLLYSHLMDSFLVVETRLTFEDHVVPITAVYQIYPAVSSPSIARLHFLPSLTLRGAEWWILARNTNRSYMFPFWLLMLRPPELFPMKPAIWETQIPQWGDMVPPHIDTTWNKPLVL